MDEIGGLLLSGLLILTGRMFLRIASFGSWKCDAMGSDAHRIRSAADALSYRREGRRVITTTGQMSGACRTWKSWAANRPLQPIFHRLLPHSLAMGLQIRAKNVR